MHYWENVIQAASSRGETKSLYSSVSAKSLRLALGILLYNKVDSFNHILTDQLMSTTGVLVAA